MTIHIYSHTCPNDDRCITETPRVTLQYRGGKPWLIVGTHGHATFREINMDDVSSFFVEED